MSQVETVSIDERRTLAVRAFQDLISEDDVRFMLNKGERRLRIDLNDIQKRNREYYDKYESLIRLMLW